MSVDILNKISQDIGELKGEMRGIREQNDAQFKLLYDHQKEINDLKLWKAGFTKVATLVIAVVSLAWSIFMVFIKDIWHWFAGK